MKVLDFGEIMLRLASPGYTKLFQKHTLETSFCGGEANVAVSLANFGIEPEFLTKLPRNDAAVAASFLKHTMEGDFNRSTVVDIENLMRNGGNGRVVR